MPKVNSFLAYLSLIILRILGTHATLEQVKATMTLEDLKYLLIEAVEHEFPADKLRSAFISDLESAIKNAIYCVKSDFTAGSWIAAVSLIKTRSLKSSNDIIDYYAYAVLYHMQGDSLEQAKRA